MGEAHDESYEVLNARGGLAIPPFIEPHIHLDTTQTAGEPELESVRYSVRGD
ncbi:cytosine deaminase [Klebsiella pneumoniae]|nr:cytosine deaminase [Klebsiella pneumoniae]